MTPSLALGLTAELAAVGALLALSEIVVLAGEQHYRAALAVVGRSVIGMRTIATTGACAALALALANLPWNKGAFFPAWHPGPVVLALAWLLVAISFAVLLRRSPFGSEGADQHLAWVAVVLAAQSGIGAPSTALTTLWVLGLATCAAYLVAGVGKLAVAGWRDGSALTGVAASRLYGTPGWGRRFGGRSARVVAWGVMVFECGFWLVLVLPPHIATWWLVTGIAFHLANAFLLGLNGFVWAFLSGYPALWLLRGRLFG